MSDTITKEQSVQLARRVFGESAILPLQELHQLSQAAYKLGYEAALAQPASEPAAVSGWKLVPVEPTAEMLVAGVPEKSPYGLNYAEACYRAMIAAAPTGEPV